MDWPRYTRRMKTEAEDLLAEVLKLPADARAKMAVRLLRSIDDVGEDVSGDEYDAAWGAEIAHRIKEIEDGIVKTIPWEDARRRIASDDDSSG